MVEKNSESDIRVETSKQICPISGDECTLKELDEQLLRLSQNALFKLRLVRSVVAQAIKYAELSENNYDPYKETVHEDL